MNIRTLLVTALLGLGALAPVNSAKADHYCQQTRVTYDCHGCPIYWVYTVVDHDCHGCPIYGWVRTAPPARHYDDDYRPRYNAGYGYSQGGHSHCDGDRRVGHGGFSFHFGR